MKVLILGCGYLGHALGRSLSLDGHQVVGCIRSTEGQEALVSLGITPFVGDLTHTEFWNAVPQDFDLYVHCASSSRGGPEVYRAVYLEGLQRAHRHLPHAKGIFISSTSVYGQDQGETVTEESETCPKSETSQILTEAEHFARTVGLITLRSAGIYGPSRGVLLKKFLSGQAVIEGEGKRWINQIHRDDLVGAILWANKVATTGQTYNVCDDEPVTYLSFYQWLSEVTGRPLPPCGPVNRERKRGLTDKRVSNQKLRDRGWKPQFPSFREGLALELPQR